MSSHKPPPLKTVKAKVEYLLREYVECRNSYAALNMMYMREFLGMPWLKLGEYKCLMAGLRQVQNVERCARKIWEEAEKSNDPYKKMLLPTDRIILLRRHRENTIKHELRQI